MRVDRKIDFDDEYFKTVRDTEKLNSSTKERELKGSGYMTLHAIYNNEFLNCGMETQTAAGTLKNDGRNDKNNGTTLMSNETVDNSVINNDLKVNVSRGIGCQL